MRLKRKCFTREFEKWLKTEYHTDGKMGDRIWNHYKENIDDDINRFASFGKKVPTSVIVDSVGGVGENSINAGGTIKRQLENILNRFEERNKEIVAAGGTPRKLTEERINKLITAFTNKQGRLDETHINNTKKFIADHGIDIEKITGVPSASFGEECSDDMAKSAKDYVTRRINKLKARLEPTLSPSGAGVGETPQTGSAVRTPTTPSSGTTGNTKSNGTPTGKGGAKKMGKAGKIALISTAIAGAGALGYGLYKHNKNKNNRKERQSKIYEKPNFSKN